MRIELFVLTVLIYGCSESTQNIRNLAPDYQTTPAQPSETSSNSPKESQTTPIQLSETLSKNLEESMTDAAKLTTNDVKNLLPLNDPRDPSVPIFKILVPTYLPRNFQLRELKVGYTRDYRIKADYYRHYTLTYYEPSSDTYLRIQGHGHPGGGGGGVEDYKPLKVYSEALGQVNLMYVQFSRNHEGGYIGFESEYIFIGSHAYEFTLFSSSKKYLISPTEAVKIGSSLKWLK